MSSDNWIDQLERQPGYAPPVHGDEVDYRCIVCGAVDSEGGCEHDFEREYITVAKGQTLAKSETHGR